MSKKYLFIFSVLIFVVALGAKAQSRSIAERTFVGGGLVWQNQLFVRADIRWFVVDNPSISIAMGIAGNFGYAKCRFSAVPELHVDFYSLKLNPFGDYLLPFWRFTSSPWYASAEMGLSILVGELSVGYAFPFGTPKANALPFRHGGLRITLSVGIPLKFRMRLF